VRGFRSPAQLDTCTAALLQETLRAAPRLEVPVHIHVSQSVVEFQEMLQRHGQTFNAAALGGTRALGRPDRGGSLACHNSPNLIREMRQRGLSRL
jgi:cytosine/adenosine deaminase-related metal-dependent hydrolase